MPRERQFRNVCWTLFSEESPRIHTSIEVRNEPREVVNFYVYQQEICPNSGRNHWQGYMEFNCKVALTTIKEKVFGNNTVHLEERRGSQDQAIDYCVDVRKRSPDTQPVTWGQRNEQGTKKGFADVLRALDGGTSVSEINRTFANVVAKNQTWLKSVASDTVYRSVPEWRTVNVIVFWGKTGSGKTRRAMRLHAPEETFLVREPPLLQKLWWDGYNGQPVVVFDDFYGTQGISMQDMLYFLDGYKLRLETKGAVTWAAWTTVYITSNHHPLEWFGRHNEGGDKRDAFLRRLTVIVQIDSFDANVF